MRTVRNLPGWPHIFELDIGERYELLLSTERGTERRTVEVLSVDHRHEPDRFVDANPDDRTLAEALVQVSVDGTQHVLRHRPYQCPVEVDGIRLYVETTRAWATDATKATIDDVTHDVRLSATVAGEPWGPADVRFPLDSYRWLSASYRNTWSSLVPSNNLYYHRGEDFGAIPDRLDVLAPFDGEVTQSPLPDGDGGSNALVIESDDGTVVRFAHMNLEEILVNESDRVVAGEVLGKNGCTWAGSRSQTHDPHLHVEFRRSGTRFSPYPTFVEAYLRDYPDSLLPVAGGYQFALPGDEVRLDGSRSLAGPEREMTSYCWRLHDGTVADGPVVTLSADRPGLYAEEMIVEADDGTTDRDFVQLRIYDPNDSGPTAYGWAYHFPVRGIEPGDDVLFWNRLRYDGPVRVAFGDGDEKILDGDGDCAHAYDRPGTYVVTFTGTDSSREPVTVKLRVIVGDDRQYSAPGSYATKNAADSSF